MLTDFHTLEFEEENEGVWTFITGVHIFLKCCKNMYICEFWNIFCKTIRKSRKQFFKLGWSNLLQYKVSENGKYRRYVYFLIAIDLTLFLHLYLIFQIVTYFRYTYDEKVGWHICTPPNSRKKMEDSGSLLQVYLFSNVFKISILVSIKKIYQKIRKWRKRKISS